MIDGRCWRAGAERQQQGAQGEHVFSRRCRRIGITDERRGLFRRVNLKPLGVRNPQPDICQPDPAAHINKDVLPGEMTVGPQIRVPVNNRQRPGDFAADVRHHLEPRFRQTGGQGQGGRRRGAGFVRLRP